MLAKNMVELGIVWNVAIGDIQKVVAQVYVENDRVMFEQRAPVPVCFHILVEGDRRFSKVDYSDRDTFQRLV